MTTPSDDKPIALVADDEPLLIDGLVSELGCAWPELTVKHTVRTGDQAIPLILSGSVDIAFLDIRMPGATGLEVAQTIAEEWPGNSECNSPPPLLVFVTAYEEHALYAFDLAAVDYVIKPVTRKRITNTVARLKQRLADRHAANSLDKLSTQLITLLANSSSELNQPELLRNIRGSVGNSVHLIPISDVVLIEASNKYLVVHSKEREVLIRESLRSILPQLDPRYFTQIHRNTIVNTNYVLSATRLENGQLQLEMKDCEKRPVVSRLYRHLFQAM